MSEETQDFYRESREHAESIKEDFPLLISKNTRNGGKAGVFSEVSREEAGRRLASNSHRLATPEETAKHRSETSDARLAAETSDAAQKMRLAIIQQAITSVATVPSAALVPEPGKSKK